MDEIPFEPTEDWPITIDYSLPREKIASEVEILSAKYDGLVRGWVDLFQKEKKEHEETQALMRNTQAFMEVIKDQSESYRAQIRVLEERCERLEAQLAYYRESLIPSTIKKTEPEREKPEEISP